MKIKNEWGNPPYHSKNPKHYKFPVRWQINYIIDWFIFLGIVAAISWGIWFIANN